MPRRPRLFIGGATYQVYCRAARGELVFDDPLEAEGFLNAARDVIELDGWRVLMGGALVQGLRMMRLRP